MDAESYNKYLGTLQTYQEWMNLPEKDYLIYSYFGTVVPQILQRPHRLLTSSSEAFRVLTRILKNGGATIGKWMPTLDYNENGTPFDEVCAWRLPENQEWLVSQIKSMKFEEHRNIIFRASISERVVTEIASSIIILGRWGDISEENWFNAINKKLSDLGWAYISLLSETLMLDFLVLSEEYEWSLRKIDNIFTENGWESKQFIYQGDRWFWPD